RSGRARSRRRRASFARASRRTSGARTWAPMPSRSTATSGRAACARRMPATSSGAASRARTVGETLLAPESFGGWGVRTVARGEARYNPMSYHNGSVWPHDNAIAAMGLARYGMKDKSALIAGAMYDASLFMDLHRLPELFCGFDRRHQGEGP